MDRSNDIRKNAKNSKRFIAKHGFAPKYFGKSDQPYVGKAQPQQQQQDKVVVEIPKELINEMVFSSLTQQLNEKSKQEPQTNSIYNQTKPKYETQSQPRNNYQTYRDIHRQPRIYHQPQNYHQKQDYSSQRENFYVIIGGPKEGIHHCEYSSIQSFQRSWRYCKKHLTEQSAEEDFEKALRFDMENHGTKRSFHYYQSYGSPRRSSYEDQRRTLSRDLPPLNWDRSSQHPQRTSSNLNHIDRKFQSPLREKRRSYSRSPSPERKKRSSSGSSSKKSKSRSKSPENNRRDSRRTASSSRSRSPKLKNTHAQSEEEQTFDEQVEIVGSNNPPGGETRDQMEELDEYVNQLNNNGDDFIYIGSDNACGKKKINFFFKNYLYKIKLATSVENSIKIVRSVLELNNHSTIKFKDGAQTQKRFRIAFRLEEFPEKELLLQLMDENFEMIRKIHPDYALGFKPNALICYLTKPGGFLRPHLNSRVSTQPFIVVWSFGCSIQYQVEVSKSMMKNLIQNKDLAAYCKKYSFSLNSRDFITFNGEEVIHGYNNCSINTFNPVFNFPGLVHGEYRMGVTALQYDDLGMLSKYFYDGEPQSSPKYSKDICMRDYVI